MPKKTIGRAPGVVLPRAAAETTIVRAPEAGRVRKAVATLSEVTPADMRSARTAAAQGRPSLLFDVLGFYEKHDDEIGPAMESLLAAALQETEHLVPLEETDEAMRQVEVAQRVFEEMDLHALLEELMWCHYYPARAAMPVWDAFGYEGATYQAPVTYERLPDWWIYARKEPEAKYTSVHVGQLPYHAYPPGTVLLMTSRKLTSFEDIDFTKFGKGLGVLRWGIYSWYNVEDWAAYNEAVGIPKVIGTLLQGWGARDKELLEQAVMGSSGDSRMIVTERTKIEHVEAKAAGTVLFKEFAEHTARIKSKVLKGESLTDNMGDKGSYAAMRTTNGIRLDVAQKLVSRAERLLNRKLLAPFLDRNFGKRLCKFRFRVRPAPDMGQELKTDETLLNMGVDLSKSEVRGRYGRSAPKDEADTLAAGRTGFNPFAGGI